MHFEATLQTGKVS